MAQHRALLSHVKSTLAVDTTEAVSRLFGVYDYATGPGSRGTFIINPEGKLVSAELNFHNVGRNADQFLRKMEASVHLMAHPNEGQPGQADARTGDAPADKDIVGNVVSVLN